MGQDKSKEALCGAKYTPGEWRICRTFNGFRVVRTWTSGLVQRYRTGHLKTEAEALAALALANRSAA